VSVTDDPELSSRDLANALAVSGGGLLSIKAGES
jgi:hypothetical protein